jgi:hypothetical protein
MYRIELLLTKSTSTNPKSSLLENNILIKANFDSNSIPDTEIADKRDFLTKIII